MKEAWVFLDEWDREMVTAALEGGADALVLPEGLSARARALGRVLIVAPDGDLVPGRDVFFHRLESAADEERIAGLLRNSPVIVDTPPGETVRAEQTRGWEVIPLENLVARGGRLLVRAASADEVELALGVLEKGVSGVVIHASGPSELKRLLELVKTRAEKVELVEATIEEIRPVGMGDRVCVDTCSAMKESEGMLIGNSSAFLFLVQAEALESPYVAPRPFRVNAGPVHSYASVPGGGMRYLSEFRAGDRVLVVSSDGGTRPATVGRVKTEIRPLLLVRASRANDSGSVILQNAETIRLTLPGGKAVSVVELSVGDKVLVSMEKAGRHFGMKVDETIREE